MKNQKVSKRNLFAVCKICGNKFPIPVGYDKNKINCYICGNNIPKNEWTER